MGVVIIDKRRKGLEGGGPRGQRIGGLTLVVEAHGF